MIGNLVEGFQSLFGGKPSVFVDLATPAGANAVIAMRYDANEIMDGATEVLAYGAAVVVETV